MIKPGAIFAGFEWVLTSKYDENNEIHRSLKKVHTLAATSHYHRQH